MHNLSQIIFFILPLIGAGISNMILVKLPIFSNWQIPMDGGYHLKDGKRLFGANKTWKGFAGMIVLTAFWMFGCEWLVKSFDWAAELSMIPYHSFQFPTNGLLFGAIWGLAYVLAELPNSYIKRRIDIAPGTNAIGLKGWIFTIVDQADSVIGCLLVVPLFYAISLVDALVVLVLATAIHLIINVLLYLLELKSQPR